MRVLWIPHTRWDRGVGHRARYVIDRLKQRHEVHVVTWTEPEAPSLRAFADPTVHLRALRRWDAEHDGVNLHHVPRFCLHRVPSLWNRNQRHLREAVHKIVRDYGIEIIVFGPGAYLVGYPPTDTGTPLVFDYVDYTDNQSLTKYLRIADAVVCVSRKLQEQVEGLGSSGTHIPNGVDFDRIRLANAERVRQRYGLDDKLVISLIGLTCSPDLYFARSLYRVKKEQSAACFLFVGKGPRYVPLRRALNRLDNSCVWTGWVPPETVSDFVKATDIGIYPGAENEYFRAACPIKILEYAAAGKTSVSSPVEEIDVLGLRSVIQVNATADSFAEGILAARLAPKLSDQKRIPSWVQVATEFEKVLNAGSGG